MASWNGQYIGNANWQGSPQFATQTELISSTQGVASQPQLTSTSAGLFNYTTGASNVLQGEINAIVATGTTALWANYRAINNVDLSGQNVVRGRNISTLNLQVSSINGADIKLFGSTVIVGGVTIVNNTVQAATVEKTKSVTDTVNQAAGAVGAAVDVFNKATTGAVQNTASVLQQFYWGTAAVDATVDLANGVVQFATGVQGLINSRDLNTIAGPAGPPGQTSYVYETINGTTQFQFSTLGSAVTTVFRTTNQANPNVTLGREVFISTILPAGSKVIRSVSDPLQQAIISTQLLSTTNYLQSFGQWHAILEPDYNLTISTLKVDSLSGFASLSTGKISTTSLEAVNMNVSNLLNTTNLYVTQNATVVGSLTSGSFATGVFSATNSIVTSLSTNTLSTGSVIVSSLNGLAFNSIIKGNDSSFNSLSTNKISTGIALISSINGLPISAFVTTGDINFNSISTNALSTGSATISSLNGLPISVYINSGDVVFNTVTANRISTARVWMSSINDSIYFTNQPNGNSITGINDLFAQTATFNTSLQSYGSFQSGSILAGPTRVTGLFRVTNGSGFNVATINTSGDITGNSLVVNNAVSGNTGTYTGTLTAGNLTTAGTLTGAGLNVSGSASVSGVITGGSVTASGALTGASASVSGTATIATAAITTGNITTANITNGNITNTNTGIINAGAGSLALTYGSITFNGSPYAPTSPGGSDITVNSISTSHISAGQVFISSINGYAYTPGGGTLPPGLVSTPNLIDLVSTANLIGLVSTPNLLGLLSTYVSSFTNFQVSSLQISSATVTGGLTFSTIGSNFDITNIFTSTTSAVYDTVSSVTNDILNYQMNLTSLPVSFDMGGFLDITAANRSLWLNKTVIYSGAYTPGQNPTLNLVGAVSSGDYFDVRNTGPSFALSVWNPYESGGFLMNITPGQFYRFTYTTSWAATANPTQTTQTSLNSFSLVQGWNNTILSTNNILTMNAGLTNIIGFAQLGNTNITDLTAQQVKFSTSQTQTANISSLFTSSFILGNGYATTLNISTATVSSINGYPFNQILNQAINIPYLSAFTISTTITNTSTINMIGQMNISTSLVNSNSSVFDITKTINLTSTSFSTISSFQNNILSYTYNATVGDETSFDIGPGYNIEANNVSQWASTILLGTNTNGVMTIQIDNDPGAGFLGTGTFDARRLQLTSDPPYDILVQYSLGGATIVDIPFNDFRLYRFTKSTAGTPVTWSYTVGPPTYQTVNNNVFQITQSLTDTTLFTTDNLNLQAGSIKFQGSVQFSNINATKGYFSTINTTSFTTTNLTGTNIQFQSVSTINESVTNLYASNTTTSTINILTGQSTLISGSYSNNFPLNTYTTPPNVNVSLLTNQLQTYSKNPVFSYSGGGGTDIITLDSSNRVWLNTTLQSPATVGWYLTTLTASTGVRVNISTVSGTQNNYSVNQQIANLTATTAAPIALYTSAAGFLGNITNTSVTLQWTGTDYNTATFIPFTGINFINNTSLSQSISTFAITTTSNIRFNSGVASNVPSISFGGRTVEVFRQRVDGFMTNAGNYGKGDAAATAVSPFGQTFPVSQYNCIVSQAAVNIYGEAALALNEQVWQTYADGNGNWAFHFYCTSATIPAAGTINFYAIAAVTMIPYDLGHFSGFQSPTNLGEGNGGPSLFGVIQLSTIVTSTITCLAKDNMSFNAGLGVPTFINYGNLALNASTNVDLMANYDITLGAAHDINATGTSHINLTSPNIKLDGAVEFRGNLNMCNYNINNVLNINGSSYPPAAIIPTALTVSTLTASTITTINASISSLTTVSSITNAVNSISIKANSNVNISSMSTIIRSPTYFSGDVRVGTLNGSSYPPSATVTSTFTTLITSTISGNPLNYLSLIANRTVTTTSLSSIINCPAAYFNGDVRVSSLNGAAVGGGGGGWVGTATSALNMGTYAINGSALTINSSNSGDFTIKNQAGSGASLNLIGDTYVFFQSRQYDMYFDPHTDIGGNAPGNFNFGGNNFYANSYQAMYFTNYGTSGYGMNFQSGDRIFMNSATQFTVKCTGLYVELNGYGGVQIVDSTTGGSGYLTVDSGNHLYWNGVYIA